ncbi:MAG: beta-ketoacyl-[acyl-carrier-protein] synthase family protein [Bacteroidales bacterium]|jgi:3-oxoacyl-[acyl-carrier-protein] synthase-1|nr:beta-ketoacyl-[acyl-carrier-protein] synthase family protein [Bacteroidales bacterium]MDD2264313.1 beta-ketoacyl-[acyl-carrier-protein] synthase family protein [Bacteroidales bacterium]MDD2831547.1 beta-ketoacyl-[acyl-carrier-protein] synthase family protein [Bacteroidales bacterium]MDD3208541.1 beta-ketoacyl-[acyl-carrier-protein] synthase family protein [Bacteroidales bacterium]MDD3697046.1 beta-ketoacyl-[acyl-carrier-protein] synthase family protein [Bacteroidales bacterium]
MKRVVITGIGVYSCIGNNKEEARDGLYNGKCGIGIDPRRTEYGYRSPLTGIVPKPDLKGALNRRQRICLPEEGEYAYMATEEALKDAGVDMDYLEKNETGILYGNDSSSKAVIESHEICVEKKDTTLLGSGAIFQSMNSTVTMNLSTIYRLRGINMTISAACASGSHTIGLGAMFIRLGLQDMIVCGGAQETSYLSMASFDGLSAFSIRTDDPKKASRPFDKGRDGLIPSGGAATIILEEYEHAVKRGVHIYAEVAGYGFSSNGVHISQPSDEGSALAMIRALEDARMQPSDIDYINAHATSTVIGDTYEAMAINRIFGREKTPVSSTKGMTGHECWMSGASEIVYTLLMMQDSFIAPNINLEEPDEISKNLNIIAKTLDRKLDICLSNSFGFGGTNSALILKKL